MAACLESFLPLESVFCIEKMAKYVVSGVRNDISGAGIRLSLDAYMGSQDGDYGIVCGY